MRRLCSGVLVALTATQAAGCIISSNGDGGEEIGLIEANWDIRTLANNTALNCPAGFDTAAVIAKRLDASQQDIVDLFDCSDFNGLSEYPPGEYQLFVQIESRSGGNVYGKSLSTIVDITFADDAFDTILLDDAGYFQFDFELVDAVTRAPLSCTAAGAEKIQIKSTLAGGTTAKTDQFNCEDGAGITNALLAGSYTIDVTALDLTDRPLGAAQTQANQTIEDRNAVTDLTPGGGGPAAIVLAIDRN